jgi:hypothetical protein
MTANYFFLESPTIAWYSGVVVPDVVSGERVLNALMLNIMYIQYFVEECSSGTITVV